MSIPEYWFQTQQVPKEVDKNECEWYLVDKNKYAEHLVDRNEYTGVLDSNAEMVGRSRQE